MSDAQTGFFLRKAAPWPVLRDAIAAGYGVPPDSVARFDDPADPIVRVELHEHEQGFAQQVDLYVDLRRVRGVPLTQLAARVSSATACDVAYDDEASQDPFRWLLVDAAGTTRAVMQSTADVDGLLLVEP